MTILRNVKAFTVVELMIAVTMLAILSTVGFTSYTSYISTARDTNRVTQLKALSNALQTFRVQDDLPMPDEPIEIRSWSDVIWYQGYLWRNIIPKIGYSEKWVDPKDKQYFTYFLSANGRDFQLLALLEEPNDEQFVFNMFDTSYAGNYTDRFPKVVGSKLWILVDDENTPVQEIQAVKTQWYIDLWSTIFQYTALIQDGDSITGDSSVLWDLGWSLVTGWLKWSCLEMKESEPDLPSGYYYLEWTDPVRVYCDMETDWGGWTQLTSKNSSGYFVKRLTALANDISEWMYQYKRSWRADTYAFKFKRFYTKQCGKTYGSKTNLELGMQQYATHLLTWSWGTCWRVSTSWDTNDIKVEKITEWGFWDDSCLNGNLNKTWSRNYAWGPLTATDGSSVWWHQHRISNTVVLFWSRWEGSVRCAWTTAWPWASEVYFYVR